MKINKGRSLSIQPQSRDWVKVVIIQKGNPGSCSPEKIWKNQGSETGLFEKHTLLGEEGKTPKSS
jgi:hypothetical protein